MQTRAVGPRVSCHAPHRPSPICGQSPLTRRTIGLTTNASRGCRSFPSWIAAASTVARLIGHSDVDAGVSKRDAVWSPSPRSPRRGVLDVGETIAPAF